MRDSTRTMAALAAATAAALLAGRSALGGAPARPPARRSPSAVAPPPPPKVGPQKPAKIIPATPRQIEAHRRQAMAWYEKARKDIAPALHLVETPHFLVFSAWPRSSDGGLRKVVERLYTHLCKQFALPRTQNVWAGKLPIYVFASKRHFTRFTNEVDGQRMAAASGYLSQTGSFCWMVLNRVSTRASFFGLLTHEGTHAFLGRYMTNRHIITWVNEGLAETVAAQLVPDCGASRRYLHATGEAVRRHADVSHIFRGVRLGDYDYGIAQSLVRFLIARDRKAFIQFIQLMKKGTPEPEALAKAYGLTHAELLAAWQKASARAFSRKR